MKEINEIYRMTKKAENLLSQYKAIAEKIANLANVKWDNARYDFNCATQDSELAKSLLMNELAIEADEIESIDEEMQNAVNCVLARADTLSEVFDDMAFMAINAIEQAQAMIEAVDNFDEIAENTEPAGSCPDFTGWKF